VSRKNLAVKDVQTACENSLKRLRTDYIDLYAPLSSRDVPEETMTASTTA
jgi:aryl-alcohol dehydrogenase-like predicted oxidoreductase